MTPAARLSAAIEVLDEIARSRAPADGVLKHWGREHRFAGSGDRRAIAERVYRTLRARSKLAWAMGADDGRALVLGALARLDETPLDGIGALFCGGHAPEPLTPDERALLARDPPAEPDWVKAGLPEGLSQPFHDRFGDDWVAEARALTQDRAPLDLRVNGLMGPPAKALNLLAFDGVEAAAPTPFSAWGLRLPADFATDVQKTKAYTTGWVEVQDESSQIAAFLAAPDGGGGLVVDYCAGGGGKTLALAQTGPARLIACDVNEKRLNAIKERLDRARAKAERRRIGTDGQGTEDLIGAADLVFVDAPCSGSGTWRRHPEGAWRLTMDGIDRLAVLQTAILARAATLVKPGGRLAYATCSVFTAENDAIADAFAAAHPDFRPLPIAEAARTAHLHAEGAARLAELAGGSHTIQLTPRRTGTDGFFLALFERPL